VNQPRIAEATRETRESQVSVRVNLDGAGRAEIATGLGLFDHMLDALARHALFDLRVSTTGDTYVDGHHSVEDTMIVLGGAIGTALSDRAGISRFGDALVPLDEALAQCAVDISGRGYAVHTGEPDGQAYALIGGGGNYPDPNRRSVPYAGSMTRHVVETLAVNAGIGVHLRLLAGRDPHHIVEAQFKALARALRAAVAWDPRVVGIPSTKGVL